MNIELERCIDVFLAQYIETTRQSYTRPLIDMSRHVGPANQVRDITPLDLLEYMGIVKKRNYADATINKFLKTIKVFFNWCVRMKFIDQSPAADIPSVRIAQKIDRNKAMQQQEFDKIIEYFKIAVRYPPGHHRWRDYACFLFLADTGCRRGGVSTLTVDRLDLINHSAYVIEKGNKKRAVYFGGECARAIENWLKERTEKGVTSKWVFSPTEEQWQPSAVSQMIRRTARKAGVTTTRSAHSLRHKFGHDMAQKMVNPKITQQALGHTNVETTIKHYYDTTDPQVEQEMKKHAYRPPIREKIRVFEPKKQSS